VGIPKVNFAVFFLSDKSKVDRYKSEMNNGDDREHKSSKRIEDTNDRSQQHSSSGRSNRTDENRKETRDAGERDYKRSRSDRRADDDRGDTDRDSSHRDNTKRESPKSRLQLDRDGRGGQVDTVPNRKRKDQNDE
jgi:hypothetical protein